MPQATNSLRLLAVCALFSSAAFAQFASYPNNPSGSSWVSAQNPTGARKITYEPAIFGFYTGSIPGGTSQYDAAVTIPVGESVYAAYLYLQSNSTSITSDYTPGPISAYQVAIVQGAVTVTKYVNGTATQIASSSVAWAEGYTYHAASTGNGTIMVYVVTNTTPNLQYLVASCSDSSPLTGTAGFSLASTNQSQLFGGVTPSFVLSSPSQAEPPGPISVQAYPQPTRVDMHAGGTAATEAAILTYSWYRAGALLASTSGPDFTDVNVQPSTAYSYSLVATPTQGYPLPAVNYSVTTPPSGAVDNHFIGVRSTGSYWGGMGEQIDVRSGNLNFSYPLVTAVSRGLKVPIALSYNSQNWRLDSNGAVWNLAEANPGGYGWNLQVGSLQAYYSNATTIHHYEFRDATGAVYHLTVNNAGVWSSNSEAAYVWYDSNTGLLHFRDGSKWTLACTAAATEMDAGTLYPTLIEDSNGNQVALRYDAGNGGSGGSGRINQVFDARGKTFATYTFTYTTSGATTGAKVPATLANNLNSGESFTFAANLDQPLTPPFGSGYTGSANLLTSVTNNATNLTTTFTYDPSGTGELDQVTFPYGGFISWQYSNQVLGTAGSVETLREVTGRKLQWDSTGPRSFTLSATSPGTNQWVPAPRTISDVTANANKIWTFSQATDFTEGLVTEYQEERTNTLLELRRTLYTWAQDSAGNPYIGQVQNISDPGQSYAATKQIAQTLDQYGNVTQTKLYNINSPTTPFKTYNNTYLNSSAYLSAYILNRLLTTTLTDANNDPPTTLVTNTYDNYTGNYALQGGSYSPTPTLWDTTYTTSYTTRGNVTQSVSFTFTRNYTYDVTGTVLAQDDGHNHKVNISTSSLTNYSAPDQVQTNGGTLTTSIDWSTFLAPTMVQNPTGAQTTTAYDPTTARPSSTVSPYGATTNYTYSNTAPQVTATITSNGGDSGRWTSTYYDGLGRPYRTAVGDSSSTKSYTDTVYEACGCTPLGKPLKTSMPYVPGNTIHYTVNSYDAIGRTVTTTAPDGASTTSYVYQGNVVTVTDPAGKWKTYTVDAFGELIQVDEPDPSAGTVHTYYTYDLLGHLTQASMTRTVSGTPYTQLRTWTYSTTTELLSSKTAPESGTTSYTYNTDGTLATVVDASSHEKKYTYDTYGRVTQIARGTLSGSNFTEDATQRSTYKYDSSSTQNCGTLTNTSGHVAEIDYQIAGGRYPMFECYSYHAAGAVTQKTLGSNGAVPGPLTATYSYDNEGRASTLTYPSISAQKTTVTYTYDSMGRPYTATGGPTTVSSATYGPSNEMLSLSTNAFNETRSYNANLQLTNVVSGSYNFTYNFSSNANNGRIQSMTDAISGETITYQYDSLNRLSGASGSGDANGAWSQTFTFDGFGNLVAKAGNNAPNNLSINVNPATNQLTGNNALYDSVGNLLQYGVGTPEQYYTYDIENRVMQVTANGVTTAYGYDTRNQRIYSGPQTVGCGSTELYFFYGVDGKKLDVIAAEHSTSGTCGVTVAPVTQTNVWFRGRLLVPQDRLNSHGKYFPYGEDRTNPNPANPANGVEKFATYTRDAGSGLDYAYQRYYTSGLGRFLTADRKSSSGNPYLPQTWNRYTYAGDDPTNRSDPSGLDPGSEIWLRDPNNPQAQCDDLAEQMNAIINGGVTRNEGWDKGLIKRFQEQIDGNPSQWSGHNTRIINLQTDLLNLLADWAQTNKKSGDKCGPPPPSAVDWAHKTPPPQPVSGPKAAPPQRSWWQQIFDGLFPFPMLPIAIVIPTEVTTNDPSGNDNGTQSSITYNVDGTAVPDPTNPPQSIGSSAGGGGGDDPSEGDEQEYEDD